MGFASRFRSSLTYPIAATLVLVTVVPMVSVGLLLISYNRTHLETVEKRYLGRQAVSLAGETSLFMTGHRTQLESTARALAAAKSVDVGAFEELLQGFGNQPGSSFVYLQVITREGAGAYVRSPKLASATELQIPGKIATAKTKPDTRRSETGFRNRIADSMENCFRWILPRRQRSRIKRIRNQFPNP